MDISQEQIGPIMGDKCYAIWCGEYLTDPIYEGMEIVSATLTCDSYEGAKPYVAYVHRDPRPDPGKKGKGTGGEIDISGPQGKYVRQAI